MVEVPMGWSRPTAHSFDRTYWLPPWGRGNGLDAAAWAHLIDVAEEPLDELFTVLRSAGIAAFASPRPVPARRWFRQRGPAIWRLWVDVRANARAQDLVRAELLRRRGE
jgi:hypothetical protein